MTLRQFRFIFLLAFIVFTSYSVYNMYLHRKNPSSFNFADITPTATPSFQQLNSQYTSILSGFASSSYTTPQYDDSGEKLLSAAIRNQPLDQALVKKLDDFYKNPMYADSPDARDGLHQWTKFCLARAISQNQQNQAVVICNGKDNYPDPADWTDIGIDDLSALENMLPFFVAGYSAYQQNDYIKAGYYFSEIITYKTLVETQYGTSSASLYWDLTGFVDTLLDQVRAGY